MGRYCGQAQKTFRGFYRQILKKLGKNDEESADSEEQSALNRSPDGILLQESLDDESSAIRLSRRSSVLVLFNYCIIIYLYS
ncbi:unnamed protein product [Thelazia callipaeda]|uniref:Uncharacterized protein n=1 Tax=Thelazia callipaeda TaxID=103827 RepID=A0A0N5DBZ5_THECL|nr:unnamed protein product [Thelazia callipaeda]